MDPALSVISHPCIVCFKPTSMWCSRCQHAYYCTSEHLHSDWPRHRRECVPIASARLDMIATPPPAQPTFVTVSAILFAPHEDRPRIITVTCEPPRTPAQGSCPTPLVQGYFPGGQATSVVLTQGLNGEPLRFPLHLWYSPSAFKLAANGSVNQAIFRITSGAAPKPWCGPVIILKYNGSSRQGYSDAGSNDLLVLSAYSFPPFQHIDSKFPSLLQHLLTSRSFSDLPFRPLFCRFGCPSIEDAHHLFVHCPPFSGLRAESETKLHSETARLLRESSLPAHILSHIKRAIATLFRDEASWPFGSSRYYLGLLPPLTPTSVSLSSLPVESRRLLAHIAHCCHSSAIQLAARIWGSITREHTLSSSRSRGGGDASSVARPRETRSSGSTLPDRRRLSRR